MHQFQFQNMNPDFKSPCYYGYELYRLMFKYTTGGAVDSRHMVSPRRGMKPRCKIKIIIINCNEKIGSWQANKVETTY